ncbi:MAG: hypothetical protein HQ475_13055 [SAR202 cluster bacterium]|nr:hypothetical protein [SAR202 cluster bacterium]
MQVDKEHVKLGIWGPTSGGKTTFLAALKIATFANTYGANWAITSLDDPSEAYLNEISGFLMDQEFPEGTTSQTGVLRYRLTAAPPSDWLSNIGRNIFKVFGLSGEAAVNIELNIVDYPGSAFENSRLQDSRYENLPEALAKCDALVFSFDPIRELDGKRENFRFFDNIAERIRRQTFTDNPDQLQLGQFLAVCITKFDDSRILERLEQAGIFHLPDSIEEDRPNPTPEQAKFVFDYLAHKFLKNAIETNFHEDRTEYFLSSSIGFYVAPGQNFNPDDCSNLEEGKIRGEVSPINVLEPLMWLESKVRQLRIKESR